jgi:voltage-gated potassium channel Kch
VSKQQTEFDTAPARLNGISPDTQEALPLRAKLYAWLLDPHVPGNHHKAVDRWIGALIIANLLALMFEHVPAIYEPYQQWFHAFDVFSVGIFTVEYLFRLYVAPEDHEFKHSKNPRLRYLRSPFAVIDLLAIAPFYLQAFLPVDLRVLRFLRLLRILKLFRLLSPAWQDFKQATEGRTFRQKIFALMFPSEHGGDLHQFVDNFIAFWVVVSVIAVVLESVHSVHYVLSIEFIILDAVAVTVFTTEYFLRLYCCVERPEYRHPVWGRLKYARTPAAIIDLLAILPFFLEVFLHHLLDLRVLRVFRLLRLLKLTRYTGATSTLLQVIVREWPVLAASAFVMMLLVIMTASLGYLFEHPAQPDKFENIPQSIYWAVITLASVGYGDISPVTPMGRLMTIILALLGIGIFAIPAALLSSAFSDQLHIDREALKAQLKEMMDDGVLSENERATLDREAKRLHLKKNEVDRLIAEARNERDKELDVATLPLHYIAANPEHAVQYFKQVISQVRQLAIMTDKEKFHDLAVAKDRLTKDELELWKRVNGDHAA